MKKMASSSFLGIMGFLFENIMKQAQKPIAPIYKPFVLLWGSWLLYRFVIHVAILGVSAQANILYGMMWQIVVLLPALLFTPTVLRANNPYRLILTSMLMLMYLAGIGVFFIIRLYENAPLWVKLGLGLEVILLLFINILLMILIKRLPPMHEQNKDLS